MHIKVVEVDCRYQDRVTYVLVWFFVKVILFSFSYSKASEMQFFVGSLALACIPENEVEDE